jgi:hypothetical protein
MARVAYRVRQFFRVLTAPLAAESRCDVERVLTPAEWALFSRMSSADRRHGLAVYRELVARGAQSRDLLAAALLHDVGKADVPCLLGVRVAVVVTERFAPWLLERLSREGVRGCRPFVAYRRHAEVGAGWAAQAGCSPCAVALIRRHHEPIVQPRGREDLLLALLQEVDENW